MGRLWHGRGNSASAAVSSLLMTNLWIKPHLVSAHCGIRPLWGMAGAYHDTRRFSESEAALACCARLRCAMAAAIGDQLDRRATLVRKFKLADAPLAGLLPGNLGQRTSFFWPTQPDGQSRCTVPFLRVRPALNRPGGNNRRTQPRHHDSGTLRGKDRRISRGLFPRTAHEPLQRAKNQSWKDAQDHRQHPKIAPGTRYILFLESAQIRTSSVCRAPVTQARPASVNILISLRTPNSSGR